MSEVMEVQEMTVEEAIQAINDYKERTGKTQSAIAQELGISSGQLSAFLSGTYKTPHTVVPKVRALMEVQEGKEVAPKEPDFAETSISKAVMTTISYCHLQGKIGVVYGDAGIGKTMAIKEYLKRNSLAIGITISPSYSSISGVNELLADQLSVRERTSRKLYAEIINKLRASGRVIIIDEAQHLTVRTLNHLRCISDESGCGICFVGNDEVYSKMRGSCRADFAQIFSRIGMRKNVLVSNISEQDIDSIFSIPGVDGESRKILYAIAKTNYGIRGAVNVFVNTAAVFGQINAGGIASMAREMNIK